MHPAAAPVLYVRFYQNDANAGQMNFMENKPNSYKVGDAIVTRIFETLIAGFTPRELCPTWNEQNPERLADLLPSACWDKPYQHVVMSTHRWLVRTTKHNVLIDTGIGNHKNRKPPYFNNLKEPFLERLAASGVKPEDIDYVLLTHLHTDHVGWNTIRKDGRWAPTFPKAQYVFSKVEETLFFRSRRPGTAKLCRI
jgi:glyoxylase-like metal-dependent hydrolase (beta-lactamase superfamily II)